MPGPSRGGGLADSLAWNCEGSFLCQQARRRLAVGTTDPGRQHLALSTPKFTVGQCFLRHKWGFKCGFWWFCRGVSGGRVACGLANPPTDAGDGTESPGTNYSVGHVGLHAMPFNVELVDHRWGDGCIESLDLHVAPRSLYLSQLAARTGTDSARRAAEATGDAAAASPFLGRGLPSTSFGGRASSWNGFRRYDLEVDGKDVLIVCPDRAAAGRPWVWHGEFFGHKPAPDIALLGKGFHVVYMRVPNLLGGPAAVQHWTVLHTLLTSQISQPLAQRPVLVGLSRGG